jgi:hypothetical protein
MAMSQQDRLGAPEMRLGEHSERAELVWIETAWAHRHYLHTGQGLTLGAA